MKELKEWIKSFIFALAIALPILFFCRPTLVLGSSMQPTLYNKNVVVTESVTHNLKHGDIVVFDAAPHDDRYYIKRVIGLPGDTVEIKDNGVYVNGTKINEPYLSKDVVTEPDMVVHVPENQIFVLGDNRAVSEDSRFIGTISLSKVKGHVYFRIFPLNLDKSGKL